MYPQKLPAFPHKSKNYTYLQYGDILPTVGVLQKLLNLNGANLRVNGTFNYETRDAVLLFQKDCKLRMTGIVDKYTWDYIIERKELPIIDSIDIFDPELFEIELQDIQRVADARFYHYVGGMSNGVIKALVDIRLSASNVFLLRFHGHGLSGEVGFSEGDGEYLQGKNISTRSFLSDQNIDTPEISLQLSQLKKIFSPYGSIQFMHCESAKGKRGEQFIQKLADKIGVPVTGALQDQESGGIDTFRFEGPTYTACPGGISLPEWCNRLPNFPSMYSY